MELSETNPMAANYLRAAPSSELDLAMCDINNDPKLRCVFVNIAVRTKADAAKLAKMDLRQQLDTLLEVMIAEFPRLLDKRGYCVFASAALIRSLGIIGYGNLNLFRTEVLYSKRNVRLGAHYFVVKQALNSSEEDIYIDFRLEQFESFIAGVDDLLLLSAQEADNVSVFSASSSLDNFERDIYLLAVDRLLDARNKFRKIWVSQDLEKEFMSNLESLFKRIATVLHGQNPPQVASSPIRHVDIIRSSSPIMRKAIMWILRISPDSAVRSLEEAVIYFNKGRYIKASFYY